MDVPGLRVVRKEELMQKFPYFGDVFDELKADCMKKMELALGSATTTTMKNPELGEKNSKGEDVYEELLRSPAIGVRLGALTMDLTKNSLCWGYAEGRLVAAIQQILHESLPSRSRGEQGVVHVRVLSVHPTLPQHNTLFLQGTATGLGTGQPFPSQEWPPNRCPPNSFDLRGCCLYYTISQFGFVQCNSPFECGGGAGCFHGLCTCLGAGADPQACANALGCVDMKLVQLLL